VLEGAIRSQVNDRPVKTTRLVAPLVKPGEVVVALLLKETLYAGYHKHQKQSRDSNAIER
jgi:hypothetical protein